MRQTREEGREEGRKEGRKEGREEGRKEGKQEDRAEAILELLEDLGEIPEGLKETVFKQKDFSILKRWLKLAAKSNSLEEFQSGIKQGVKLNV